MLSVSTDAQAATMLKSVHAIIDAVERFAIDNGRLPNDSWRQQFPSDLKGYVSEEPFRRIGPDGEKFDWDGPGTDGDFYAMTIVYPSGVDAKTLPIYQVIETKADDGSPTTGWITTKGSRMRFKVADK
jgi:hypothetical protein